MPKKMQLESGQILCRDGQRVWIEDIRSRRIVWVQKPGDALPEITFEPDPVLLGLLEKMDADFAWQGPFTDQNLYSKILQTHAARNHIDYSLEQTPVLPHTAYKRVNLLPKGESFQVLLVGDDDLMAIPLALLGHAVTVLEIDDLTIQTIEHYKKLWGLEKICVLKQDLTKPLPDTLEAKFDFAFTDPLSTYNCLMTFLSRAVSCLKSAGRVFLALSDAGYPIGRELGRQMHLTEVQRYRDFNHYYTPQFNICYYISHYVEFQKSATSKPLLQGDAAFTGDLFSFAKSFDYHSIQDYYGCEVFTGMKPAEIIGKIHEIVGSKAHLVFPTEGFERLAIIAWKDKSVRVRLDPIKRWIGIDAVPLEHAETLQFDRKLHEFIRPQRVVYRVSERNPGRD